MGTGKIGRNTCRNLVDYLATKDITLINRTGEKAEELARELGLSCASFEHREKHVAEADIVIVATNADKAVISKEELLHSAPKILIDLSIPNNIEPAAGALPHIVLANVDDLSHINDKTLQQRTAEIPAALLIIQKHIGEFSEWRSLRSHVPVLRAVKQKLQDIQAGGLFPMAPRPAAIQKVVNSVAVKLRAQHQPGCYYIEAINDYMTTP